MKYTREIPTKPGWYWVRPTEPTNLIKGCAIGAIELLKSGIPALTCNGWTTLADDRFEYAGPIEEPEK